MIFLRYTFITLLFLSCNTITDAEVIEAGLKGSNFKTQCLRVDQKPDTLEVFIDNVDFTCRDWRILYTSEIANLFVEANRKYKNIVLKDNMLEYGYPFSPEHLREHYTFKLRENYTFEGRQNIDSLLLVWLSNEDMLKINEGIAFVNSELPTTTVEGSLEFGLIPLLDALSAEFKEMREGGYYYVGNGAHTLYRLREVMDIVQDPEYTSLVPMLDTIWSRYYYIPLESSIISKDSAGYEVLTLRR